MRGIKLWGAAALVLGLLGGSAQAELITTTWDPNASLSTTATGTLDGSAITLTTSPIPPNGGTTAADVQFALGTGTAPAVAAFGGISDTSGAVLGAALGNATLQTITSASALINPVLFFNYLDPSEVFDFTGLNFVLLSAYNATQSGSVITADASAGNTGSDGFAIQLLGSFTSINFTVQAATSPVQSPQGETVAFTIGVASAVPEPTTVLSALLGAGLAGFIGRRRGSR